MGRCGVVDNGGVCAGVVVFDTADEPDVTVVEQAVSKADAVPRANARRERRGTVDSDDDFKDFSSNTAHSGDDFLMQARHRS